MAKKHIETMTITAYLDDKHYIETVVANDIKTETGLGSRIKSPDLIHRLVETYKAGKQKK